jgi:hypothetical protein
MLVEIGSTKADIRVKAVMSMPRLSFTANHMVWWKALLPLGIEPTIIQGAFWSQCLSRGFEQVVEDCEYIVAIDYDTFMSREDVEQLFALTMALQCDALAPFQTKRDDGKVMITPLGTFQGAGKTQSAGLAADWFGAPVQEVDAAHFGCTIVSTAALKRMKKPWFWSTPSERDDWNDGRVDDDMFFWQQWRNSGNRVFVTPRVVVGHGEYNITWPGMDLSTPVRQSTRDYSASGKPSNVWKVGDKDDHAAQPS